jgi:hypothetical protein
MCSESTVLSPWSFFPTKATDSSNCTSNTEEYQTGHIEETIGSLLLLLLHQKKTILFQPLKLTLSSDDTLSQQQQNFTLVLNNASRPTVPSWEED